MKSALQKSSLAKVQRAILIVAIMFVVILAGGSVQSQSNDNQGYASTGVGVAFRLSGDAHPHGTQFNALEAGYEFRYGLGAVGSFTLGNFDYNSESTHTYSSYRLIMAGPMYVLHLNRRSSIDIKAQIGYWYYDESSFFSDGTSSGYYSTGRASLGYFVTTSYQYRVADRWSLFGNLHFTTNAPVAPLLTAIGITVGVGFRF